MLNKLLGAFVLLTDNWIIYEIVAIKIYFGMLSLALVQIFRHTCSEQILYSWKMLLYVYFHVANHTWVVNTKWTILINSSYFAFVADGFFFN